MNHHVFPVTTWLDLSIHAHLQIILQFLIEGFSNHNPPAEPVEKKKNAIHFYDILDAFLSLFCGVFCVLLLWWVGGYSYVAQTTFVFLPK